MKKKIIVKTRKELKELIVKTIKEEGNKCDLNFIDTSLITNMSWLFHNSEFNGDISEWDTSRVTDMSYMFFKSRFNGDISKWNVGNVRHMCSMFYGSKFNKDIGCWDTKNVRDMSDMFLNSMFNQDISNWNTENVINYEYFSLKMNKYNLPSRFRDPLEQSKSYIGWKKLQGGSICKLLIPEDAVKLKVVNSNKCRSNKAKVLYLINREGCKVNKGYSFFKNSFIYRVGEEVIPDNFDSDRWNECSHGINFFLTREEAEDYNFT